MGDQDFHKQNTLPGINGAGIPSSFPERPKFIGPYKIENLLEQGGMSLVYLGSHAGTHEPVIVKVLLPKFLSHPDIVQRFLNEAEIIAMADHPNIVKMYGHGEWENGLYIAMEFVQGVSLRHYLLHNPISLRRALEIIIDTAYALCHLHTHGVIHRDLKPENVLITESGTVKVIDFGIAQLLTESLTTDEKSKPRLIGTPIYMSPEQRDNPGAVSFPSDIYSLGIIAYELILGKLSHGQIHLSLMPKGMQKILNRALQPNIKNRYQDIVDFISDISAYMNSDSLLKDKKAGDYITDMIENLKKAQSILVADQTPQWPYLEIGLATQKSVHVTGVYQDFFDLPNGLKGVIMAESSAKEAEGLIHTSMFRGMMRSLCPLSNRPLELMTVLNELLLNDPIPYIFNASYLIFNPIKNQCFFISCGYGRLWKISAKGKTIEKISNENIALGIDSEAVFNQIEFSFEEGDQLILSNFAGVLSNPQLEIEFGDEQFQKLLEENINLPSQKLAEAIMRTVRMGTNRFAKERSIAVLSIRKKQPV